jgi:hypothetical protein
MTSLQWVAGRQGNYQTYHDPKEDFLFDANLLFFGIPRRVLEVLSEQ